MYDFNMIKADRRTLLLGSTALAAGMLASCGTQTVDVIKTVADLIQKIQAGVKQACTAFGTWVPTVDTVLGVLASLLGAAVIPANLAQAVAFVQAAIDMIAKQCPAAPGAAPSGTSAVPIAFY